MNQNVGPPEYLRYPKLEDSIISRNHVSNVRHVQVWRNWTENASFDFYMI